MFAEVLRVSTGLEAILAADDPLARATLRAQGSSSSFGAADHAAQSSAAASVTTGGSDVSSASSTMMASSCKVFGSFDAERSGAMTSSRYGSSSSSSLISMGMLAAALRAAAKAALASTEVGMLDADSSYVVGGAKKRSLKCTKAKLATPFGPA